jgi:hypothetical protein
MPWCAGCGVGKAWGIPEEQGRRGQEGLTAASSAEARRQRRETRLAESRTAASRRRHRGRTGSRGMELVNTGREHVGISGGLCRKATATTGVDQAHPTAINRVLEVTASIRVFFSTWE